MTGQALSFLGAAALGGALGLVYDLFRLLRGRLGWRLLGMALDLLYWPLAVAALFVYSVAAGDGEVRFYLMAGVALGGVLYFLFLSWLALLIGGWAADLAGFLWSALLRPVRWFQKTLKKIWKKTKKFFHYRLKWYRIRNTIGWPGRREAAQVQIKKAGFLTKIVVLTLLVASAVSLLRLQGQISEAREEQAEMERKVAQQSQVNADLRDAIDHSSDPDRQEAIARSELNLAAPGEKVIIVTD